MRKILLGCMATILFLSSHPQNLSDFKIVSIDKDIDEFNDIFDLRTVLSAGLTYKFAEANGRNSLFRKLCIKRNVIYWPSADSPDTKMSDFERNKILKQTIIETIEYRDTIACVIFKAGENKYLMRWFENDHNKWLDSGEDALSSKEDCRKLFYTYAETGLKTIRQEALISEITTDTLSLINYLMNSGQDPKEFFLDASKKYKLVIYGEIHQRRISWEFLTSVINDQRFSESVGVIFMEMASNKQKEINQFMKNDSINRELLLSVFRDYMITGWPDKGMFDFVISVWKLNRNLPSNKKIKIVAVDTPREYTEEGLRNEIRERDDFMANTIIQNFDTAYEKRNAIFIVGSAHVCKTMESAGQILAQKYTNEVFTIFTHSPRVDNYRIVKERIRHGIFDYAFSMNGDNPVGFKLKNSPFGREPFDGLYLDGSGIYQDNYDGYIFLGNLEKEPNGDVLFELYNEDFIHEVDKRYKMIGLDLAKEWELDSLTVKSVMDKISCQHTKTRWEEYLKE